MTAKETILSVAINIPFQPDHFKSYVEIRDKGHRIET